MRKFILLCSLCLCLCLCGCGKQPTSNEVLTIIPEVPVIIPEKIHEPVIEEVVSELITNSKKDIVFNNVEYDLPIPMESLNRDGWILAPGVDNVFLMPNEKLENVNLISKDFPSARVLVTVSNIGSTTKHYSKCYATSIVVEYSDKCPHVCVGALSLGATVEDMELPVYSDLAVHLRCDDTSVTQLGVSCIEYATKDPSYNWLSVPTLTISDIQVTLPTDGLSLEEHGWDFSTQPEYKLGSRLDTDAVLKLYGEDATYTGLSIKEKELCIDVYCYGLSFDSSIDSVLKILGDNYYSYYVVGNKKYLTYNEGACYLTVGLIGDIVCEFKLSNCKPLPILN